MPALTPGLHWFINFGLNNVKHSLHLTSKIESCPDSPVPNGHAFVGPKECLGNI